MNIRFFLNRTVLCCVASAMAVAVVVSSQPAGAAAAQDDAAIQPYLAVVTGNDVYVRSGGADSYYPFGKVNADDLVWVVGEKFNWARVEAGFTNGGPTFSSDRFFGFVIHPTAQASSRFRLEENGTVGVTLGRTDVLAPNLNAKFNPNDSWKPLIRLDANRRVAVMETTTSGENTVHKIRLPENAEAWISKTYLRRANATEVQAWEAAKRRLAEGDREQAKPETASPKPTPAPVQQEVLAREEQPRREAPKPETTPAPTPAPAPAPVVTPADEPPAAPTETPAATSEPVAPEAKPKADDEAKPAEPTTAERLKEVTLDDLEAAYAKIRREPTATAELSAMRQMYLDVAARSEAGPARFANARAEQLKLLMDVQDRLAEIARIKARAQVAAERTQAVRDAVDAVGDYAAVGRLAASTIYDGRRLPQLIRVQDTTSGRTVAYIEPSEKFDVIGLLGQLVGIVGEKAYDGGLRLNIITPRRIDILAPQE